MPLLAVSPPPLPPAATLCRPVANALPQASMDDVDDPIPLSQLANDAFNPIAPHDLSNEGFPAGFPGVAARLAVPNSNGVAAVEAAAEGAGPGPASAAQRPPKGGKLFQVRLGGGGGVLGLAAAVLACWAAAACRRLPDAVQHLL